MCILPWDGDDATDSAGGAASRRMPSHNWRLLTGHDSGNVLVFDPRLPHFKPVLTIHFGTFHNIAPKKIAVLETLGLLCITRADGTVQLLSMLTARSHWMNNALNPLKPVCSAPFVTRARPEPLKDLGR